MTRLIVVQMSEWPTPQTATKMCVKLEGQFLKQIDEILLSYHYNNRDVLKHHLGNLLIFFKHLPMENTFEYQQCDIKHCNEQDRTSFRDAIWMRFFLDMSHMIVYLATIYNFTFAESTDTLFFLYKSTNLDKVFIPLTHFQRLLQLDPVVSRLHLHFFLHFPFNVERQLSQCPKQELHDQLRSQMRNVEKVLNHVLQTFSKLITLEELMDLVHDIAVTERDISLIHNVNSITNTVPSTNTVTSTNSVTSTLGVTVGFFELDSLIVGILNQLARSDSVLQNNLAKIAQTSRYRQLSTFLYSDLNI